MLNTNFFDFSKRFCLCRTFHISPQLLALISLCTPQSNQACSTLGLMGPSKTLLQYLHLWTSVGALGPGTKTESKESLSPMYPRHEDKVAALNAEGTRTRLGEKELRSLGQGVRWNLDWSWGWKDRNCEWELGGRRLELGALTETSRQRGEVKARLKLVGQRNWNLKLVGDQNWKWVMITVRLGTWYNG